MRLFLITLLFFTSSAYARDIYFQPPNEIKTWVVSCDVDQGSITGKGKKRKFRPSANLCDKGFKQRTFVYKQRSEIRTDAAISAKANVTYHFQTIFDINANRNEKFDIFQVHDDRDGCAPPLKVNIFYDNTIKLYSDYKTGPGESCKRQVMSSTIPPQTTILRDGTQYVLDIYLDFDGKGGFIVDVYIDNVHEAHGVYTPPQGDRYYFKSKYFYFKHGSYSSNMFDYELNSEFFMKKITSN